MEDIEKVEITSFEQLSALEDGDFVLGIKNGIPKLYKSSSFTKSGEVVKSSESVGGYKPEDLVKVGDEIDADKLGGFLASAYALKKDMTGIADDTLSWACPILWHSVRVMPDGRKPLQTSMEGSYVILDGMTLDPQIFVDLYNVIGYTFTEEDEDRVVGVSKFRVPNLVGRFPIGVSVTGGGSNNPELDGLVHSHKYPQETGQNGGEDICHLEVTTQMVRHSHDYQIKNLTTYVKYEDSPVNTTEVVNKSEDYITKTTEGACGLEVATDSGATWGTRPFQILNPCLGMVWVMRVCPKGTKISQ